MNATQQDTRIALACGWEYTDDGFWIAPKGSALKGYDHDRCKYPPPFSTDLEVMHDAESRIPVRQRYGYMQKLFLVIHNKEVGKYTNNDLMDVITATAAQRAKAFLLFKKLWVE